MNNEVINCIPLYLNEPTMALNFLVEKFGFVIPKCPVSKNLYGMMVCDSYGNFYEIFSNARRSENNINDRPLVIKTTDCLQDFHNIAPKGLSILNKPHYVAEGLIFEISDHWNNKYTFLEKRNYTD